MITGQLHSSSNFLATAIWAQHGWILHMHLTSIQVPQHEILPATLTPNPQWPAHADPGLCESLQRGLASTIAPPYRIFANAIQDRFNIWNIRHRAPRHKENIYRVSAISTKACVVEPLEQGTRSCGPGQSSCTHPHDLFSPFC